MVNNDNKILNIAMDGPAGSGKSTAARELANVLGIEYIDTGAMYRAVAYKALTLKVDISNDDKIAEMLSNTEIDFVGGNIYLDGKNINDRIRNLEISKAASKVSKLKSCRIKLVDLQRKIAKKKSIVMDGRDIGTNVLPDANYKFYITASTETRAKRRYDELKKSGSEVTFESVVNDIISRDIEDTTRELNPLKKAEDAIELSTDDLDIATVISKLIKYIGK